MTCEVKGGLHGVVHFKSVKLKSIVQTACASKPLWSLRCRERKIWWKREKDTERRVGGKSTSTHPWGPPEKCWNSDCVSSRVHYNQSARLRALEAEACARCTTPGHFSLFWSLWFWNKPSFRGTPWAPSEKVNSPYPSTRPSLNSPSNFMPSYRPKTPAPWNFPCKNSPSYLDPSVKSSTPEPWKSPFSNWPE